MDALKDKVNAHKRLGYIPGEATFWPNLTGAETLHLLGRIHGSYDQKYRDELIETYSNLNPIKSAYILERQSPKDKYYSAFITRS